MGLFSRVKKVTKPLVDAPKWMQFNRLSETAKGIAEVSKAAFIPRKTQKSETFEQAVARLNLTEEGIRQRYNQFRRLFWIFSLITLLVLAYAAYHFINGHMGAGLISSSLTLIGVMQMFYYSFWSYQIKERRLGVSLSEWFYEGVLGRRRVNHAKERLK